MVKRLTMLLASLFLVLGVALAQTQVSGYVTSSEDGEPVIGASIKVVGTSTGTVTDVDGNALCWASSGTQGIKGSKKSTPYAAGLAAEAAAKAEAEAAKAAEEAAAEAPAEEAPAEA